jgi:hypothetical protein
MPLKIHTLTENTHDVNAVTCDTVKKEMRPGTIFVITGPHLGARPSALGMRRYSFDVTPDFANISLRLVEAPAAFCVVPDLLKVRLGTR